MKSKYMKRRKIVTTLLALGLFIFVPHTNLWADEMEGPTVKVYGTVESSNLYQKTFTFQSGEKVSITNKTKLKDKEGRKASFSALAKKGIRLGVKAREVHANYFIATSIWEDNDNY